MPPPSLSSLKPTDEQLAVIEAAGQSESVMVDALAGCSKSTTLQLAAPKIRVPALALAFNKKIADELKPRLPSNFTTKTFNGLGFAATLRALPQVSKAQLEDKKLGKLVSEVAKERKVELSGEQWDELRRLCSKLMQVGVVPGDRGRPLQPDTPETWEAVAEDLWLTPDSLEFYQDLAREVLERDIALVRQGVFSFDDQVYFSACIDGQFPKFPVIFVDESQDLSPLNHAMLAQSIRPDGKLVVVGDPLQAIYAFRGADAESMAKLRGLRPSWLDRPLKTTFRCPKAIVARQQEHAPGYTAWHTNAEGRFAQLQGVPAGIQATLGNNTSLKEGWDWVDVRGLLPHPSAEIFVLCRNTAPLLGLAFKLIRNQIGCQVLGRDIGKSLVVLSRKLLPEDSTPRDTCAGVVAAWVESETSLARANGHEERCASIMDRGECLQSVLAAGARDAGELRVLLEKLFARNTGVTLSTIHRAKGLEADVVLHLDPFRIPSRWAREAAKKGDRRQLQQEWNLRYVAETRTKHTLINAELKDCLL